jgi:transcriptional regulator with XRE-family HTH domain
MQPLFITAKARPYDEAMQTGRPSNRPRSAFGARLHAAREAAGLTQGQVAEKLGITQTAYALWERRDMALRPDQIEAVAKVLNVTVEHLFGQAQAKASGGPVGKVRQTFEEVSRLPRRQQQHIVRVVTALVAQAKEA